MRTHNARHKQALRYQRVLWKHQMNSDAIYVQPNCLMWQIRRDANRSKASKEELRFFARLVNNRWTRERIAQQVRLAMALHWAKKEAREEPSIYHNLQVGKIEMEIVNLQQELLRDLNPEVTVWDDDNPPSALTDLGGDTGDVPQLRLI